MNERRALALVPLLFGVWFFGILAPYGIQVGEDGDMLYQAYATWRGQLPYLDFSTGYTPLYFYWHALLFQIFGVDALVIRVSTAAANTLTLVLMYRLAAELVRPRLALLAPLVFVAGLQVFPGEFCAFNIPYPAWYNVTLWLGSLAAIVAYARQSRLVFLVIAGLLAGISFSMKPNTGLFNVAALGVFLVWWQPPSPRDGWLARAAWWLLALGTCAFVLVVFRAQVFQRTFVLFPLPVVTIIVLLLINARQRRCDDSRFLAAAAAFGFGVAVPILPWALYFLTHLGIDGFLRDVLLIGTSYERFFFVGFRPVGTFWDVALLAVGTVVLLVPILVQRRLLPAWLPLAVLMAGGSAAAAYVALFAPMRYGFVSAVTTRVQDLSFFALLAVNWWGVWLAFRVAARPDDPRRSVQIATLIALGVSAPAFTLGMYPRSDFAHLIVVAPVAIVLGVVLLGRLGERWGAMATGGRYWRTLGPAVIAAPVAAIAIVMAVPALQLAGDVTGRALGWRGPGGFAYLDLPHATLIREAESGGQLHVLHDTAAYLMEHSGPRDYVFPFPNLSLLGFLAGRLNPTPKGYFIAGYPDHETEAGIVRALADRPPRLIVALRSHELFVTTASMYYLLVRDAVRRGFVPSAQIGPYVVLAARDANVPPFEDQTVSPADPDVAPGLDDPDPVVQLATASRLRTGRDPRTAVALLARAAHGNTPHAATFTQMASEFADERSIPTLVRLVAASDTPDDRVVGAIATDALYFAVQKAFLADFWFVPPPPAVRRAAAVDLDPALLNNWLRNRNVDSRLRIAAAWAAAWRDDHAAVPHLLVMLGSSDIEIAKFAAYALTRLGETAATTESLIALQHWDDVTMPSLLLDLYQRDPAAVRPAVERGLRIGTLQQRLALTWIAAASGDRELVPTLTELRDTYSDGEGLRRITETALAVLDAKGPA
jgi:hypothetical protein